MLCSWFNPLHESSNLFKICDDCDSRTQIVHSYIPVSLYLCTLTNCSVQCFQASDAVGENSSIMPILPQKKMATARKLLINDNCKAFVDSLIQARQKLGTDTWIKIGYTSLYESDKTTLLYHS